MKSTRRGSDSPVHRPEKTPRFQIQLDSRTWQITKSGGTSDFPQTADSSFDPSRGERGPYNVYIGGLSSDIVTGMGLPLKQHVVYLLKFKKIIAPPVTPSPSITPIPGGLTEDDIRRIINDVMREKFR